MARGGGPFGLLGSLFSAGAYLSRQSSSRARLTAHPVASAGSPDVNVSQLIKSWRTTRRGGSVSAVKRSGGLLRALFGGSSKLTQRMKSASMKHETIVRQLVHQRLGEIKQFSTPGGLIGTKKHKAVGFTSEEALGFMQLPGEGQRILKSAYILGGQTPEIQARRGRRVAAVASGRARRLSEARQSFLTQRYRSLHGGPALTPSTIKARVKQTVGKRVAKHVSKARIARKRRTAKQKIRQTGPVKVKGHTRRVKGKAVRVQGFSRKRGRR